MAKDYSFDVVCRTDLAEAANAVNQAEKEIRTRYDFKGSKSSVTLSEGTLTLLGDDEFKLRLVREIVNGKLVKRGISLKNLTEGKKEAAAGGMVRQVLTFKNGIEAELAKDIVKRIKGSGIKVQAKINGDELRVSGKDKDALQATIAFLKNQDLPADLHFFPITELPPLVAMPEGHALAHLPAVSIHEIAPHPMVLLDLPMSADYFLSFFTREGLRANIAERTRDMAVMRSLVANGFGYSIVNLRPLNDVAPDGKPMRFVPLTGQQRPMNLGLLMSEGAERTQLHKAFMAHAQDWIEAQSSRLLGLKP